MQVNLPVSLWWPARNAQKRAASYRSYPMPRLRALLSISAVLQSNINAHRGSVKDTPGAQFQTKENRL
jgi:hypothetical protein